MTGPPFSMHAIVCAALLFALAVAAPVAAQPSPEGRFLTTSGAPFSGRIAGIDEGGDLQILDAKNRKQTVAKEALISWGLRREPGGRAMTLLNDGGILVGDVLALNGRRLRIGIDYDGFSRNSLWEPLDIPLEQVCAVLLRPPSDPLERDRLALQARQAEGVQDTIYLTNGDRLRGIVRRSTIGQAPEGEEDAAGQGGAGEEQDPVPEQVFLKLGGRDAAVPAQRIAAILFNPSLRNKPRVRGNPRWLGFRDGSWIRVRKVEADKGNGARLETATGLQLKTERRRFWSELCAVESLGSSQFDYLSDLPDAGYVHLPFLNSKWPLMRDRNVLGGRLRSGDGVYTKGLGMHSVARVAYALDGKYRRFEADLAIDRAAGRKGSVVFRVFADGGDGKFRLAHRSEILRGGEKPTAVSIDVRGARRLALIVDLADHGDVRDLANWLRARLIR